MSAAARLRRAATAAALASAALAAASPARAQASNEARTAAYLAAVRDRPPLLYAFVREMPKGADLHSHLSGAVYAESFLRWAAEDSLCVSRRALAMVRANCAGSHGDTIPVADALNDGTLYGQLIDAASMRNWNPARRSGHDQFFDAFTHLFALPAAWATSWPRRRRARRTGT